MTGELLEMEIEFEPSANAEVTFAIRGVPMSYDAKKQEITVNGRHAPAPLRAGRGRLTIFVDRTGLEILASDGLTFLPLVVNLDPQKTSLSVTALRGSTIFHRLDVHELHSAWNVR